MAELDPDIAAVLAQLPDLSLTRETLPSLRQFFAAAPPSRRETSASVEELFVPGSPPVRVLAYRPAEAKVPMRAVVHLHGGGCVMGSPEMADPINRRLADELGCAIFSVDYRLAPEHPFPAAHDDCFLVLNWLRANADALSIDSSRIGAKGESAGGGLAVALAARARDEGGGLAFLHLESPMLDDRTCLRECGPHVGKFVWTAASNRFAWKAFLGVDPGSEEIPDYAAAGRIADLGGLPPTYLAVGALDLFLGENLDFVARLARAGVAVEAHIYPGACHGFQTLGGQVSRAAAQDSHKALRRQLDA